MSKLLSIKGLCLFLVGLNPIFLQGQIVFSDQSDQAGLGETGPNYGVGIADYDKDGWEDIYITRRPDPNRLFKNIGGSFVDVAPSAGVDVALNTKAAIWADFDNDGWLDLFLANAKGQNDQLFKNNGNGSFTDISASAGIQHQGNPFAAITGDVDRDGYLDIYLAHFDGPNVLWHNNGNLSFTDITAEAGVEMDRVAMGATFIDFDRDGDEDIYLPHDGYGPNVMFANDGSGSFYDVAPGIGADIAAFGMGVDVGDINNDGWPDMYITNLYPNNLLLNDGQGSFVDIRDSAGVGDPGMGWGTAFLDVDNDGFQDIYLANTPKDPNVLYHNNGDLTFTNISAGTPISSPRGNGFGVATFDYNKDGRLDILLTNSNDTVGLQLFRNDTENDNHWLSVSLESQRQHVSAIGARVEVIAQGHYGTDVISGGSSWVSQHSPILHFGLGEALMVDTLRITWPDASVEEHYQIATDQLFKSIQLGLPASLAKENSQGLLAYTKENHLHLSWTPSQAKANVKIMNLEGRTFGKFYNLPRGQLSIPIHHWPSGFYLVQFEMGGKHEYRKILLP